MEALIIANNNRAMQLISMSDYKSALSIFKRCLRQSENVPNLRAMTLNNLGCLYKRTQEYKKALDCFEEAMKIKNRDSISLAGTHLNLCTTKSAVGSHSEALKYAQQAITLLNKSKDADYSLAVAYHKAGLQQEKLGNSTQAKHSYQKALTLSLKSMGEKDKLTETLRQKVIGRNTYKDKKTFKLPLISRTSKSLTPTSHRSLHAQSSLTKVLRTKRRFVFEKRNFDDSIERRMRSMEDKLNSLNESMRNLQKNNLLRSALTIQKWFKTQNVRSLFLDVKKAVIVIQRFYRKKHNNPCK